MIKQFLKFLEKISSRPQVAGLAITNGAVQYLSFDGKTTVKKAYRLPPGVIKNGRVENKAALLDVLKQLRETAGRGQKRLLPVIVSLPAENIYNESFKVPNLGPERLNESAELNLRLLSPLPEDKVYMDYQVVKEKPDHYDILGVFVEKERVDIIRGALEEARYLPLAFEFPALSLARLVGPADEKAPPIFIFDVSSDGLNFIILKNSAPYFNYFRSWYSIQGEAKEITQSRFEEVVVEEIRKVINFTFGRFKQSLTEVVVVAPQLENELTVLIEKNFTLKGRILKVGETDLDSGWYAALGAALRGRVDPARDHLISLNYLKAADAFYREQILNFTWLWRNIYITILTLLLFIYIGALFWMMNIERDLARQAEGLHLDAQAAALEELRTVSGEFNGFVAQIAAARGGHLEAMRVLKTVKSIADINRITLDQMTVPGPGQAVEVKGRAADAETVRRFKNALTETGLFGDVILPLSRIVSAGDNFVSFSLTLIPN